MFLLMEHTIKLVSDSEIIVGKQSHARISSKSMFLFMDHSGSWVSESEICVGKYFETGIISNHMSLCMEHTKSWSVILQFMLENTVKQESIKKTRFLFMEQARS